MEIISDKSCIPKYKELLDSNYRMPSKPELNEEEWRIHNT